MVCLNSFALLKDAGVLAGNRVKEDLTPQEYRFVENTYKAHPEDELLRRAYLLALKNRGISLHNQGDYAGARSLMNKGLEIDPNSAEHLYILGRCLHAVGEADEAIRVWEKAAGSRADYIEPLYFLTDVLCRRTRFADALRYAQKALLIQPENVSFLSSAAYLFYCLRRFDEALEYYARVLKIQPDDAHIRADAAKVLLLQGKLAAGFQEYEWRVKEPRVLKQYYHGILDKPAWQGEVFTHKRLLVHSEQGLGDIINFVRYLPMVKSRGGTVVFSAAPELMRLFARQPGVDELVEHSSPALGNIEFDLVIPLLSLPHIFGTTLNTIPAARHYLTPDRELVSQWGKRLLTDSGEKRVGLAWAAKMPNDFLPNRSCGLAALLPLFGIPGIQWYSLQKGEEAKQVSNYQTPLVDLTGELNDFADTAALVANLDIVITVDTAVAHLAGAMGKPTWVLLSQLADWRWLLDRDDSPWYPSVRLFRQPELGDWDSVIGQVARELAGWDRN